MHQIGIALLPSIQLMIRKQPVVLLRSNSNLTQSTLQKLLKTVNSVYLSHTVTQLKIQNGVLRCAQFVEKMKQCQCGKPELLTIMLYHAALLLLLL